MYRILILILTFLSSTLFWGQQPNQTMQCDSIPGYNPVFLSAPSTSKSTIENFSNTKDSKQSKTFLGNLFNQLVVKDVNKSKNNAPVIHFDRNLEIGQGKIIRNVDITTLDPFGFSETDTLKVPTNKTEKFGNRMHLKTKKFTIRNFLLFEPGDKFDSLMIKESERLLRSQRYVRRVLIYPIATNSVDSVDVVVRELDYWTIYPNGSLSTSSMRIRLTDRNFAGLGHEFSVQYRRRIDQDKQGYYFNYYVNNIQKTFIRANILYDSDVWGNYQKYALIDRPFYSPYAKWGAGVNLTQRFRRDSLVSPDNTYSLQPVKYNNYDFWAGYSIALTKNFKEREVITNLRASLRYIQRDYVERPQAIYDTISYYSNSKSYLASLSISSINYVQDHYIFTHDKIEDVQIGKVFSITGGFNNQYNKTRSYFGAKLAMGKYTNLGYFSSNLEWGSYFVGSKSEQGAIRWDMTYFTKLLYAGKWKFRHFINPQIVLGYHRYKHMGDELNLEPVIAGIRAWKLRGTRRIALSYQFQAYAPYNWKGFHISPYVNVEGAFLGYEKQAFLDTKLYSRLSIGIVANNDYLVFSSIAISLVYYPTMPDSQQAVFYANGRKYDMSLPNFNYDRPQTIPYY
ncbi:hypothetical protein [Myroides sp. LJL119]